MAHLHYIGVLLFVGLCSVGVGVGFRLKIPHLWRTFLYTDLTLLVIYLAWDIWAIYKHNWYFDQQQILNVYLIPRVPIEEVLFFVVVPFTTILTYKALAKLSGWSETGGRSE